MPLTPSDVRQVVRAAPSAAAGLRRVLALSGAYVTDDVAEALTEAVQTWHLGEPHIACIRDMMRNWREPQARRVIEWQLRERALRGLIRDDLVFAAKPVITIHFIDVHADSGSAPSPAVTDEQADGAPDLAWIEIRLTVPVRPLPDAAPAPALEPR